jgi:hypothetical protein
MTEELLSTLVDGEVLVEADADGELSFGEEFLDNAAERTEQVERDEWRAPFADGVTQGEAFSDSFAAVAERTPELLGTYWALDDALEDVTFSELLQSLVVIDRFRYPPTETGGTPDGFLAVRGDRLPALVEFVRHGVVYVWREDCDPCDVMVEQFAELDNGVGDAVFLSVYGPPWAAELHDSFEVAGAPTTLFLANGRVDSRLMGAYEADVIETELETAKPTSVVSPD